MPNISLDLYPSDPDPADSTAKKNHAGPGLPNQTRNRSERNTMLGNLRPVLDTTARRFAELVTADRVIYTPQALNALIDTVASREVAGRLRERADWHSAAADDPALTAAEREWHLCQADDLDDLAERELREVAR